MGKIFKPSDISEDALEAYRHAVLEELPDFVDAVSAESNGPHLSREAILEQARKEAEQKMQEAYQEGFRRGFEDGKTQFERSVGEAARALNEAAEAMRRARKEFLTSLEPQIIDLVKRIASLVVEREAGTDEELVKTTVRKCLGCLLDCEHITIYANPTEIEVLREHKITLLEQFDEVANLHVRPDEAISPGGCRAESELVHIDGRLETQLERIFDAMRDVPVFGTATHHVEPGEG